MRVAYVCADSGVPVFGTKGCSIHVQEIIRAFLRRGDTVDLFVARVGGDTPADLRECGLYQFPVRQVEDGAGREAALQQNAARLAEVLPLDQYDLIYERYSLWSSAAIRRAAASTSPTVLEVNAPLIQEQQTYRRLDDVHRANRIATEAFHLAGSVVAVSTETAEYVRTVCRDASGFSPNHVHVIPNGVDVNRFRPAKLPESDPAEVTIGFVGSLKPWHGVDFLLEAFLRLHCECQNVRLHIIGDGPMRESLQQSAAAFPATVANSIEFRGVVSPEDMPEHLNRLDIAVAPYGDTRESWFSPLKVYEYMACGLAVVASRTGQLCDLVEDGVNGLLVPPGDCEQLATALTSLVRSAELRHHLGVAARQTVVRNHSWDHTLETILATVNNDRDEIQNSDRKRESQFPPELSCGTALRMMN